MNTPARALAAALALNIVVSGCAKDDLFRGQPQRLAYEVGEQTTRAHGEFKTLWNWYVGTIDPKALTTDIEVCLTISPQGKVIDSYIDASTIRQPEFVSGVLGIYNRMQFGARDVEELTICDEPMRFYSAEDTRALARGELTAEESMMNFIYGVGKSDEPAPESPVPPAVQP